MNSIERFPSTIYAAAPYAVSLKRFVNSQKSMTYVAVLPSLHVGSATTFARHMGHVRSRSNQSDMQSSQKMCCKENTQNKYHNPALQLRSVVSTCSCMTTYKMLNDWQLATPACRKLKKKN